MRIALCDSDAAASLATKQMIYEYASIHNIELVVSEYRSGKALLSEWEKYFLVILDYTSEDLNGLETARLMRQKGGMCGIIFLSADTGFILDSFKVRPYRFLLKPLSRESLFQVLDDFFTAASISSPLFIKDGEVYHQIYRGGCTENDFYQKISDTLTVLAAGGERL